MSFAPLLLECYYDTVRIIQPRSEGALVKHVPLQTFLLHVNRHAGMDTGWLAPQVVRLIVHHNHWLVAVLSRATRRTLCCRYWDRGSVWTQLEYSVPAPPCLFFFLMRPSALYREDASTSSSGMFCLERMYVVVLKTELLEEDMPVFRFPFGNVDQQGLVCLGNAVGEAAAPRNLHHGLMDLVHLFWSSTFVNDYYTPLGPHASLQDCLAYLSTQDRFPLELLAPLGQDLTLQRFLEEIRSHV